MRSALATVLLVLMALGPSPARAHEVLYAVERGHAIALKAFETDGDVLDNCEAEVYSPANPNEPFWKGRTDRHGWVAFVPDTGGSWRVKVVQDSGHGLDARIPVEAPSTTPTSTLSTLDFVLRPALAVLALAAVFGGLWALYRRRVKTAG